jgi:hypothetical protein
VSDVVAVRSSDRATLYLVKIRKITLIDRQVIRAKLFRQLEGFFDIAFSIAKGKAASR